MIAIFLPPFPFRGVAAPYLWVFYKFLTVSREKKLFIIGKGYLPEQASELDDDRWEFLDSSQQRLGYTIPEPEELARHHVHLLGPDIFNNLMHDNKCSPSETFKVFLTRSVPRLSAEIEQVLSQFESDVEAVITWCNCPSLSQVAQARNIPVIHLELGPLRSPDYRPTMYVDFSGVNGNSEAKNRYEGLHKPLNMELSVHQLLGYFLIRRDALNSIGMASDAVRTGVVLQVEDDSNLIAFGNNFDNRGLLSFARLTTSIDNILVRGHPGSLFQLRPREFAVDDSDNSMAFIAKCQKIITINSSVGVESLLQGRTVQVLGECAYKFITEASEPTELTDRLTFYLFSYLVPAELGFDLEYLRFRLKAPEEAQIVEYHLRHYSSHRQDLIQTGSLAEMIESELKAEENDRLSHLNAELEASMSGLRKQVEELLMQVDELRAQINEERSALEAARLTIAQQTEVIQEQEFVAEKSAKTIEASNVSVNNLFRKNIDLKTSVDHASILADENEALKSQLRHAAGQLSETERELFISRARIDGLLSSTSWKITSPARFVRTQMFRATQFQKALILARRQFGSPGALLSKARVIYRREGVGGLKARIRYLLENSSRPPVPIIATEPKKKVPSREIARHTSSVDIVVCVHNAPEDVKNCLESIHAYTLPPFRIIIVDDGSAQITQEYLADYAAAQGCVLHRNEVAGGYTKAANCGLRAANAEYVILLNSDTIVSPYWLERLLNCADSDPAIGLVGPLSNTASWQSVPEVFDAVGDWTINALPTGMSVQDYASEVARESSRIYPQVGFINGFCFLIKQSLISQIGIFDEDVFGRGYGEENDYCLRAAGAGWKLAIADDAYVYHAQSKSYSHERRMELSKAAGVNLANKHGQALIDRQLNITVNHPALEYIRRRTALIERKREIRQRFLPFQGKRILFLLPARTAGGGANIILLEASRLIALGVDAQIVNLRSNKDVFEENYPDNQVPIHYILSPEQLPEIARYYDAVIATLYLTVEWISRLVQSSQSVPIVAYYVQDFEPDFFPPGSTEYLRALDSYSLVSQMTLMTKTRWTRDVLKRVVGVECAVLGADYDDALFYPGATCRLYGGAIAVTAMVRPETPRRAPGLTMKVLKRLKMEFGSTIVIRTFGADCDNPSYQGLGADFEHECLGQLTPQQVSGLLQATDIFLDYSTFQAMGLTAMEAAACGAITIGPLSGGLTEIITDSQTGVLIDTSNEQTCFSRTCELIRNTQQRIEIGKNIMDITQFYPEQVALKMMISLFGSQGKGI